MTQLDTGELPNGWECAPLAEIALLNPRTLGDSLPDDAVVSFVPMAAVEAGSGVLDPTFLKRWDQVKRGFVTFAEGDVLLAKITPCMENGKFAVARRLFAGHGAGSTEFHVVRPMGGIEPQFLLYYFLQERFRRDARAHMRGAAGQLRVPKEYLEQVSIPLPPLPEQRRIVVEIETQLSRLDAAVAALGRARANLRRYRAAVLAAAVTGGFNPETLNGWTRVPLGDVVARSEYGTSVKCSYDANGIPVLRIPNVARGRIDLTDVKYATQRLHLKPDDALKCDDLLVIRTNGSIGLVGRSAVVTQDLSKEHSFASYLLRYRFHDSVTTAKWVHLHLSSPQGRQFIEQHAASSAGQHNVSLSLLSRLPLPLPPIEEQHRIVAAVERRLSVVEEVEAAIGANQRRGETLRQAVLRKAFAGELVPQDPTDEPAAALLERIRAERAAAGTPSRRTRARVGRQQALPLG